MMRYGDAIQEVVDALKGAGIRATADMSKLQLPGAIVVPGTLSFDRLSGTDYSAQIEIYLLTSNKGTVHSFNDLQDLLDKFRSVYDIPEAEPISVPLANIAGPDPVPGLFITLQATITKD